MTSEYSNTVNITGYENAKSVANLAESNKAIAMLMDGTEPEVIVTQLESTPPLDIEDVFNVLISICSFSILGDVSDTSTITHEFNMELVGRRNLLHMNGKCDSMLPLKLSSFQKMLGFY